MPRRPAGLLQEACFPGWETATPTRKRVCVRKHAQHAYLSMSPDRKKYNIYIYIYMYIYMYMYIYIHVYIISWSIPTGAGRLVLIGCYARAYSYV